MAMQAGSQHDLGFNPTGESEDYSSVPITELKRLRQYAKASLTKSLNKLKFHRINEDFENYPSSYETAKQNLQHVLSLNSTAMQADTDQSEVNLERYINYENELNEKYADTVLEVKTWYDRGMSFHMPTATNLNDTSNVLDSFSSSLRTIVSHMNMPKQELPKFNGDPADYLIFKSSFKEIVLDCKELQPHDKLTRLYNVLGTEPQSLIKSCLIQKSTHSLDTALSLLDQVYGNEVQIAENIVQGLLNGKKVTSAADFLALHAEMQNAKITLKEFQRDAELDGQNIITAIVSRIRNFRIVEAWKTKARALISNLNGSKYPTFDDLLKFIQEQSRWVNDVHYGLNQWNKTTPKPVTLVTQQNHQPVHHQKPILQSSTTSKFQNPTNCFFCGFSNHLMMNCIQFLRLPVDSKVEFLCKNNLCLNCISGKHLVSECKAKFSCKICQERHHYILHGGQFPGGGHCNGSASDVGSQITNASVASKFNNEIWFPVLKVFVNGRAALALIDHCSTHSYITTSFANSLCLKGWVHPRTISTLNGTASSDGTLHNFTLNAGDISKELYAYSCPAIPVPMPKCKFTSFDHLKRLPITRVEANSADLLLGNDMADLIRPLEIVAGSAGDQPYAVRTALGWYVCGSYHKPQGEFVSHLTHPQISHMTVQSPSFDDFQALWNQDQLLSQDTGVKLSAEDTKVLKLWAEEVKVVNGHIQLPIPLRSFAFFPNSKLMAEKRLMSLMKRLRRENMFRMYDGMIEAMLNKGYAEEVKTGTEDSKLTWYIPHHPVPKKGGKIRIVHDCAATVKSKSLNTEVLQGPDLNNTLIGVLLRFRRYWYASIGDISEMYMQVKVPPKHRDLLRFLWVDTDNNFRTFRMTSHIFGGVWSPAAAIFALKHVAAKIVDNVVRQTIENSFYVDDLLVSFQTSAELKHVMTETQSYLESFGFQLKGVVSNIIDMTDRPVKDENPSSDNVLLVSKESCGALGVQWNPSADSLSLKIDTKFVQPDQITKRTMLSCIASIYDPLGIISPVLLQGRQIFQRVVKLGVAWDETLPSDVVHEFERWLGSLDTFKGFSVPRCVNYVAASVMHTFVDASSTGYGCCIYICSGKSSLLLFSKAKVLPLKITTIPRLELCAAVLGAKVSKNVQQEIGFSGETFFWTDSAIVLGYIKNQTSRYKPYVRNRIDYLHSVTEPELWRHVPGTLNPADIASRGSSHLTAFWLQGPEFLIDGSKWPPLMYPEISPSDPELITPVPPASPILVTHAVVNADDDILQELLDRASTFSKLRRIVATLFVFIDKCKGTSSRGDFESSMNVELLERAERVIFRYAQRNVEGSFKGLQLKKQDGILRIDGRIQNSNLPCNQIFIPSTEVSVLRLLIHEAHAKVGHMGLNATLAELRQRYWIARRAVKIELAKCSRCKLLKKKVCTQKMGLIPNERLGVGKAPFYFTGLDCFGPFVVTQGRKSVKRWGLLLTCMTIRAIHLEKLDSLDTSSFLNALERFFARRGIPNTITSDNGLNFVRGNKELSQAINELNQADINGKLLNLKVNWKFIPPYASHHGGVYERQIRTVRQVLSVMLQEKQFKLTDEILHTFFCHVECIVNSRPITPLPSSPNDDPALRPSEILLCKALFSPLPLKTSSNALNKAWKQCHSLADCFWRRWLRHYLPLLQQRSKWLRQQRNITKDDIVLVVDAMAPRGQWKLGRVVDVKEGSDGLVRSADLVCDGKIIKRPIVKLVNLELV